MVLFDAPLLQNGHTLNLENVVQIRCAPIYRPPLNLDYFFRIGYGPILKVRSHNFAMTKTNVHDSGFIFLSHHEATKWICSESGKTNNFKALLLKHLLIVFVSCSLRESGEERGGFLGFPLRRTRNNPPPHSPKLTKKLNTKTISKCFKSSALKLLVSLDSLRIRLVASWWLWLRHSSATKTWPTT